MKISFHVFWLFSNFFLIVCMQLFETNSFSNDNRMCHMHTPGVSHFFYDMNLFIPHFKIFQFHPVIW